MSNVDYLRLRDNVTHWGKDTVSENLQYSVIDFYKWAFLEAGAYQNITRNPATSGVLGGQKFTLSYTNDPRFTAGKVWQGFRSEWIWETGVNFTPPPTSVNVYVNNVLQPTNSGYYVDYPRGRIVFDNAISSGSNVQANFASRSVNFVRAEENWFRQLMFNSHDVNRSDFTTSTAGGKWSQLSETRRQLPVVGVEVVGTNRYKPYQIGGGQWQYLTVLYYVYSEKESERDRIRDILSNQNDKVIWLYNRGLMKESPRWPFFLDSRGSPISGFWTYPTLVSENNSFRYLNTKFQDTNSENLDTRNDWLYGAVVRTTAELINPYG